MKLIAIDLDGTLLSSDGQISKINRLEILKKQQEGHVIVISTGRSLHDAQSILEKAELMCPIIAGNGAVISYKHEIIYQYSLKQHIVKELIDIAKRGTIYFEIYTSKGILMEKDVIINIRKEIQFLKALDSYFSFEKAQAMVNTQFNQYHLTSINNLEELNFNGLSVYKFFILTFDQAKNSAIHRLLKDRKDISITVSDKEKIEIGHPIVSKGNALNFFCSYIGVPPENTVAIGDNENDLSMFKIANTNIVMENANSKIKQHATHITKSNNNNGVAWALQAFI